MIRKAMVMLLLAALSTGCLPPPADALTSLMQVYSNTVEGEVSARKKAERSKMRELLREQGLRVCEEGEVGTTWREDCNSCRCLEGGVRTCTMAKCRDQTETDDNPHMGSQ